MNPQQEKTSINSSEYVSMVNYLIETLNKSKSANIHQALHNKPIFLFEFFVFDLYVPAEILRKIKQPVIAFRFLDFPTLTLQGTVVHPKKLIQFNQGKSSYFEMEIGELKEALTMNAMYIMLIDMNYGDMSIIASSRLNISIFAYDSFVEYENGIVPKPRRNILKLFDNVLEKVAEFEMSLLIRREYYRYETDAFPYNEKKIIIQENNKSSIGYNNKQSTYARPVSNDLRMKSTDDIIQSQIIQVQYQNQKENQMKEKEVNFMKKNAKNASVNTAGYVPNLNSNNDSSNNGIKSQKKVAFSQINPSTSQYLDQYQNNSEPFDLKKMLNSNEKNPPPLYFHNSKKNPIQQELQQQRQQQQQQQQQERYERIIHEEHKSDLNQEQNKSPQQSSNLKQSTGSSNASSMNQSKPFTLKKKKKDKEIMEEMYQKSKKRYEDYLGSNSISVSSSGHRKKKYKVKLLPGTNNKIEEKEKESDDDYDDFANSNNMNQASDEKNEYLKLFNQIKSNVRGENPKRNMINKSASLKEEDLDAKNSNENKNKQSQQKDKEIEESSNYYNENEFNNVFNSGIVSSGNIIQSFQQSNDIPFESGIISSSKKIERNNTNNGTSKEKENEKEKGKVPSAIIESNASKYSSSIYQSIQDSSSMNYNINPQPNQKQIGEEKEKDSDIQTNTNKSQIITEENIIKKKSVPSINDSSSKIEESSALINIENQKKRESIARKLSIDEESIVKKFTDDIFDNSRMNQSSIKEEELIVRKKKKKVKLILKDSRNSSRNSDNNSQKNSIREMSPKKNDNEIEESIAQISESHPEYKFTSVSQNKIGSYSRFRNSEIEEMINEQ